jgi:hypothetical protein
MARHRAIAVGDRLLWHRALPFEIVVQASVDVAYPSPSKGRKVFKTIELGLDFLFIYEIERKSPVATGLFRFLLI